jgi:hypothetical protein
LRKDSRKSFIWQAWFVLKTILIAIFKIRNIKTLLYRFATVAMVLYYYFTVEKITYENRVANEYSFLIFILVWHFISMNFKILEKNRLKKNE